MNKSLLIIIGILFLSCPIHLWAQQQDSIQTNQIVPEDEQEQPDNAQPSGFNFWEERFKGNWAGIFIGFNRLDRADYSDYPDDEQDFMESKLLRSQCLNINLIQTSLGLQRNRNFIGLVTGLGMDIQTYTLDNNNSFIKGPSRIQPKELSYEDNLKSKFSSAYLCMPLLLEFQVPVKHYANRLYFSAGVIGSLRLSSHTKIKYRLDGKKQKLKVPGDYYLNDIRFAGTVRIGYRWINLFGTYDLQPLFKEGKGPELYPFSFGIALITF